MPVVGMQISAGGFHGCVAQDLLEDVQRDAGIGHPRRTSVAESLTGEVRQAEAGNDRVPVGGVSDGRGSEHAALGADEELVFGGFAFGKAFEDGPEGLEYRDAPLFAALGGFGDESAFVGEDLPVIMTRFLSNLTSPTCNPETSEERAARNAASMTKSL
jgi:hypothetical protein